MFLANTLLKGFANGIYWKGEDFEYFPKFLKGDSPNSIIARADKALYVAKNNGKNQMYMEVD